MSFIYPEDSEIAKAEHAAYQAGLDHALKALPEPSKEEMLIENVPPGNAITFGFNLALDQARQAITKLKEEK